MPTRLLTEDAKAVRASTQLGKSESVQRLNWVRNEAIVYRHSSFENGLRGSIWYKIQDRGEFAEKMLEGVQRLGVTMVIGAFKTAAGVILEAEAGLFPITIRLRLKIMRYTIGLHTLPASHPWWQLRRNIRPTTTKVMSLLRRMLKELERDVRGPKKTTLEVIQPFS